MDSERELLKKSLGDEFVEGILLAYTGEVITEIIGKTSGGLLISIPFLVKLAGYGDLVTHLLFSSLRIFHVRFKLDLALSNLLS